MTKNVESQVGSHNPPSSSTVPAGLEPGSNSRGTPGCPSSAKYVFGLTGVVIHALDTLKNEMLEPTEANIADCIRYGDPKHPSADAKIALKRAIKQKMIVKQRSGSMRLYIREKEQMWKFVNPVDGNAKDYSRGTWKEIKKFLTSPPGRAALLASQRR